jgi:hypothetical protein
MPPGSAEPFGARRHIDAVVLVDDNVAKIDADAKRDAPLLGVRGVALGHRQLHFDCAGGHRNGECPALERTNFRQRTDEVAELNRDLEARVAEQRDELGRVGRLKRFLPPHRELIVSQGDEKILESHRREIVVVFCDLRGYTTFTETANPKRCPISCVNTRARSGRSSANSRGTLDQFSDDGIIVFFNDPVPIPTRPNVRSGWRWRCATQPLR